MTIKEDYNKILEGCGNAFCGYSPKWGTKNKIGDNLCPSCSKAKQVFLQRCQSELKWLNEFDKYCETHNFAGGRIWIKERISQLKEVLEKK